MIASVENDKVLQHFLLNGTPIQILKMYTDGYPLDAQGLEALYCRGFSKGEILPMIKQASNISSPQNLYDWLCGFIGKDEADNFVADIIGFDTEILKQIPTKILAEHSRWDILVEMRADDILYHYKKYDMMSTEGLAKHQLYDLFFKKGGILVTGNNTGALKYLEENKLWRIICANASYWSIHKKAQPFLDILIRNKCFDDILSLTDGAKLLAESAEGIAFLKRKNEQHLLAKAKLYEEIDWNVYFVQDYERAVASAVKAKKWQVLVEHECSKELWSNKKYLYWLKSLL